MFNDESKPSFERFRNNSLPEYPQQILGQLRALRRAAYGSFSHDFTDSSIRVFVENSVDTDLGRRIQLDVEPTDRVGTIIKKYLEKLNITSSCELVLKNSKGYVLKQDATIKEVRIQEDDVLYLEQSGTEGASSLLGCLKPALLIFIFGLCIAGCVIVIYMTSPEQPSVYTILLDAGSVHTSVFVYKYAEKHEGTGIIEQVFSCEIGQVGVSSFARKAHLLQSYLNSTCFRTAAEMVYNEHDIAAPILLAGTAGLRTLRITAPEATGWILGNLTTALTNLANKRAVSVKIISGENEGLAGWVTANYLTGVIHPDSHQLQQHFPRAEGSTFGALDWGGASSQVTMEVDISQANFDVTLYGHKYHLFTQSHLCYGQKMAIYRHRAQLVYEQYLLEKSIKRVIDEPCAPIGSEIVQSIKDLFNKACTQFIDKQFMNKTKVSKGSIRFVGTGEISKCKDFAETSFDYSLCSNRFEQYSSDTVCMDPSTILPPPQRPYYAFSTYWYLISALGLPETHSLQRLEERVNGLCSSHRSSLVKAGVDDFVVDSACYKALFMIQLITKGYHFDNQTYQQIKFVKELNGAEVGWTLGHTIISSNHLPAVAPTQYISDLMFAVCMVGVFFLAILSVLFVLSRLAETVTSRSHLSDLASQLPLM